MLGRNSFTYFRDQVDDFGWRAIPKTVSELAHKKPNKSSEPVWGREWDVLVILDACRYDWMTQVAGEFDFIDTVEDLWSVGGHSREWLEKTFSQGPKDMLEQTAYLSGNPFVKNVAQEPFSYFEDVQQLNYGSRLPAPPAHVLTDRAVAVGRKHDWNRLIVHYMQPHRPFYVQDRTRRNIKMIDWSTGTDLYHHYFDGKISLEELHDGYRDNLRYVLNEVELLIENIDAGTVAISADHGHALGERFLWDHRSGVHHPTIRRVPWVETTATDLNTLQPTEYDTAEESNTEDQLRALGYM